LKCNRGETEDAETDAEEFILVLFSAFLSALFASPRLHFMWVN
jgi:hypothetical protein